MGLADEVAEIVATRSRDTRCPIARIRDRLTPDDAAELDALCADPIRWPNVAIQRALKARGFKLGNKAMGEHRRGECTCGTG